MKTKLFLLLALPMLLYVACSSGEGSKTEEAQEVAEATSTSVNYTVDPANTTIGWIGKKVTGQHDGNITIKSGTISVENGEIT